MIEKTMWIGPVPKDHKDYAKCPWCGRPPGITLRLVDNWRSYRVGCSHVWNTQTFSSRETTIETDWLESIDESVAVFKMIAVLKS